MAQPEDVSSHRQRTELSSPTLIAPPVGSRPASQQPQPDGVPSYESSAPGLAVWSAGGGPPMSGHLTVVAAGLLLLIVISATVVGLFVGRRYIGRLLIGRRRQQQQQHQHHRRPSSSSVCSLPSTIVNGRTRGVGAVAANGMATASGIGGQAVTSWLLVDQMQQSTGGSGSRGSGGSGAAVSLFDRVSAVVARNENYWSELTMTGIVDSTGVPSPIVFGCGSGSGSGTLIGIGGGVAVPVLPTQTIVQQNLTLLDEIGEGAFGKVYKGRLAVSQSSNESRLVAVKMLKDDTLHEVREDFLREVKVMASFDHDNILRLIGIVPIGEHQSPYMVFEYMAHGDLTAVLRYNDPVCRSTNSGDSDQSKPIIKPTDLVSVATQIANGMKYLASRHFVHRDLATRNCLVDTGLVVKISDFGMSRDVYTCDYYKVGGSRMLPVRWMSVESVVHGRYTTESDVWAYGVVLWEIYTYGKQPYYGHSNEEVIRFIEDGILLQKPSGCSDTIYHVMLGCWRRDPRERFTFERIHRHLVEYEQHEQNRKQ